MNVKPQELYSILNSSFTACTYCIANNIIYNLRLQINNDYKDNLYQNTVFVNRQENKFTD